MPEMKNNFQGGKMNKDLDERLVPNNEYRDALNIEVTTSEDSEVGTIQTIKGNIPLSDLDPSGMQMFKCIGSIADDKNDKLYFFVTGASIDIIAEYNYKNGVVAPVCVDTRGDALKFDPNFLITGINIIDDLLFWTDNNSEPKRISITRGKWGSSDFVTHTDLMVRDISPTALPNTYTPALGEIGGVPGMKKTIHEKHLTVIRKGPPTAPVLEMIDTTIGDWDGDTRVGGSELIRKLTSMPDTLLDSDGDLIPNINFSIDQENEQYVLDPATGIMMPKGFGGTDFPMNSIVNIYKTTDRSIGIRVKIDYDISTPMGPVGWTGKILSGNIEIEGVPVDELVAELEQGDPIFQFKFPRFAYRYKYEDGEYSAFSPFTQPAFIPGKFNYLPKEGYNLGMVNRLRKLVIKDFIDERMMGEDVVAVDILYKDSNSTSIYSVKTIKRVTYNPSRWDEWNGISETQTSQGVDSATNAIGSGWFNRTTGYLPITTEMIRAVLPANQLLRPWDNVPRKALAQELIGNRLVYGNYLQNYNFDNKLTDEISIKVHKTVTVSSNEIGETPPEQIHSGKSINTIRSQSYSPAKSIKTLRTYQLGVVYIDQYGRETPVFSEKILENSSIYLQKDIADKANQLNVKLNNTPPSWATHFKFFIKETSNEYYNLAMDRWYDADDGNVWLSFPSAERNKVDEQTFLILKKEHDNNNFVNEPARYKIIAIENEAPRFIKLKNISMGSITDSGSIANVDAPFGAQPEGFPMPDGFKVHVAKAAFEGAGWESMLIDQDISEVYFRVKSLAGISNYYRLKNVNFDTDLGYILTSGKQFGPDMSHTSPDDTWYNRSRVCELQIVKKIPEEQAQFEGRFFVKILKDGTLIDRLHMVSPPGDNLVAVDSMKVQYISPVDALSNPNFNWDGYGTDPYAISIDEKANAFWASPPGMTSSKCDGKKFWKMAGDNTSSNNTTESSGWFIDKVEAFRPFKDTISKRDHGVRRAPQTSGWSKGSQYYDNYKNNSWNYSPMLQAAPINTYSRANFPSFPNWGTNYLNVAGLKQYIYHDGSPNNLDKWSYVDGEVKSKMGGVGPSLGINKSLNIIHLSYAGLNTNSGSDGVGPTSWSRLGCEFSDANKHVLDTQFINKLRMAGTVWRWKEDPGQVLYMTKSSTSIDISDDPGSVYRQRNRDGDYGKDHADGEYGVVLYNYAVFSDYILKVHHNARTEMNWCDGLGGNVHNDVYTKPDWATRHHDPVTHTNYSMCQAVVNSVPAYLDYLAKIALAASWKSYSHHTWGANDGAYGWTTNDGKYGDWSANYRFPAAIYHANIHYNKRRRFTIHAETVIETDPIDPAKKLGLGQVGPHFYLPTNDPTLEPHFGPDLKPLVDTTGNIVVYPTNHPSAGNAITTVAPGIRPDGMHSGHPDPNPYLHDNGDPDIDPLVPLTTIPTHKSWDTTTNGPFNGPRISNIPGSVTWEIVEQFTADPEDLPSPNPAIWETEPKEDVGLDIYHEIGQIYPINITDETIEQFVGSIHEDVTRNSFVELLRWDTLNNEWVTYPTLNSGGMGVAGGDDVRVVAAHGNFVMLGSPPPDLPPPLPRSVRLDNTVTGGLIDNPINTGDILRFWRSDGSTTQAFVGATIYNESGIGGGTWYSLEGGNPAIANQVHDQSIKLPWFNCYSFGNGVESDRIRDDFNQITIDNGPKASTTIEEPYLEERRKSGFIWSGLYNSTSGVNDLNQFIQAEKITKDANPTYGSIQKLHARDSDLVAFCEDRVLKVLANKDALFNADGNTNLVATDKVLGSIKPFVGDYGISLNPESFASDSYRSYFSDTSRGAILRLSRDGITAISDAGMRDWFADNLSIRGNSKIIGSFDDNKNEYNITLQKSFHYDEAGILGVRNGYGSPYNPQPTLIVSTETAQNLGVGDALIGIGIPEGAVILNKAKVSSSTWEIWFDITPSQTDIKKLGDAVGYTVEFGNHEDFAGDKAQWITKVKSGRLQSERSTLSYSEQSKGWVSFKSWYHENGVSLNNSYYTFWHGNIYEHHINETRNNFYGSQRHSSVDVLFNKAPGVIKSFSTLNYEGSQARVTPEINNNPDYYDNLVKKGWYVKEMISNAQELGEMEFWDKEDKWFSQIKGVATEWLNDGTAGNIDPREFSYQGIGNADGVACFDCPSMVSYNCEQTQAGCNCVEIDQPVQSPWNPNGGTYATLEACENSGGCCGEPPESWCCASCDTTAVEIEGVHCGCGGNYYEPTLFLNAPLNTPVSVGDLITGDYIPAGTTVVGIYDTMTRRIKLSQKPVVPQPWKVAGGTTDYPLFTDIVARSAILTACYDPGDGSGQWDDKCTCVNTSMCCGNGLDYFFTCKNILPPAGTLVYGCMDDGVTTDPWMVRNRPIGWTGPATNYDPSAHVDNCTCEYISTPPVSFACVLTTMGGTCFDPGDGSGPYTTLTDCQSNCQQAPTWNCGPTPSSSYTQVGCFDPGFGIGTYTSLTDCQNNCSQANVSYDCHNGVCIDPGTGNGQYATFFQCHNSCVAESWDCNFGWCSDPGNGTGQYSSLTACQTACDPLQTFDCNLVGTPGNVTPTCMPAMNGGGQYASLADCNLQCGSISTTYDCINGVCIDQGMGFGQYHSMTACLNDGCSPAGDPLDWEMRTQGEWTDRDYTWPYSYRRYNSYHKLRFIIPSGSCKGHNNPRATYSIKVNDWWISKSQTQNKQLPNFDARRELGIAISSVDYTSSAYLNNFGTTLDIALDMAADLNGNASSAWLVNDIHGSHIGSSVGGGGIEAQPHFPSNQSPSDDNFLNTNFTGSWSAYDEGGNTYLEFKVTCIGDERFKYGANNNSNLLWEGKDMSINIGGNDDHVSFPSNLDDGDSFTDSTWYKTSFQYGQNHDSGTAPGVRGKASSAFPGSRSNWSSLGWFPNLSYVQTPFPDGANWGIEPGVGGWGANWLNAVTGGSWIDSPNVTINASPGSSADGKISGVNIFQTPFLRQVRDRALEGNTEAVIATLQIDCTSWNCVGGTCVDPLDGSGIYSSYSACQQNCAQQ